MTAEQLARWILSLPEEIRNGAVTGIVHGKMFTAKRAVAYDAGSDFGIYIEPMGTHADPPAGCKFPSYINYGGETHFPKEKFDAPSPPV